MPLRVMTLNAAHARGLALNQTLVRGRTLRANLGSIAAVLRRERPDLVALQEADGPSIWSGRFDHVALVARAGGYDHVHRGNHSRIGAGARGIDYGTALIGRLALDDRRTCAFQTNWRDTKGFVAATVAVPAFDHRPIDVVSVHLDFARAKIRAAQIDRLIDHLAARTHPVVIMGDLNCGWADGSCVERLARALDLHAWRPHAPLPTYPTRTPRARLDWILASRRLSFVGHRVLADPLSDHLGVVADLASAEASAIRHPS